MVDVLKSIVGRECGLDANGDLVANEKVVAYATESESVQKNNVVCLGDSIFSNGLTSSATTNIITARNFLEQAFAKLGQRLRLVHNGGNSGDTTAQMLARFETDVTPYDPSWVIVDFGVNDFAAPRAGTDVYADLLAMYTRSRALGAKFLTIGAVAGGGFNVAANFTQYSITMDLCQQSAITLPGWYHFPASVAITDYSTLAHSYYSFPATDTTYDNQTHPSAYGSGLLSTLFYNFFNPLVPDQFKGVGANRNGSAGDTRNLAADGLNIDTTGVATNGAIAGISGTYSGLWFPARNGAISAVMSQELRDATQGQPGNWQVMNLSGATAATDYITYAQTINIASLGYLAGDQVYAEADLEFSALAGTLGQMEVYLQALDSAFSILYTSSWNRINSTPEYLGWSTFAGRASTRSAPLILPTNAGSSAGLTNYLLLTVKVATSAGGSALFKLGGVEARRLID